MYMYINMPHENGVAYQRNHVQRFEQTQLLAEIRIGRSFNDSPDCLDRTVHTFTDASEQAYAAVSYIRVRLPDGAVHVTSVMAKSRPAPIKRRSIPMLELQDAVLGVEFL